MKLVVILIILSLAAVKHAAAGAADDAVGNQEEKQPPLPQGDIGKADEVQKVEGLADGNPPGQNKVNVESGNRGVESTKAAVKDLGVTEGDAAKGNAGFMHAFVATLSVIVVSELGDKTFFISAIMSMRHSRVVVFAGAMSALALMHVMSALFGTLATLIPRKFTFYLSSGLFVVFGLKMLREGWKMSPDEGQEEYEETQAELKKYEDDQLQAMSAVTQDPETGIVKTADMRFKLLVCVSPLFIQAATLNFLAEWGDRSQIAAIVLAARENLIGVIIGGLIGHFLCTGLAVIAGRWVAQRLSVRTVTILGGVVFLLFALSAFIIDPTAP